eukprot:12920500-Prorocentrum_lima.AAC.1
MSTQAPSSATAEYTVAKDKHGEDVTGLWKYYHRLMSQVILHGLGSEVPKPIDASVTGQYSSRPCI